jgi:hypothetical protein
MKPFSRQYDLYRQIFTSVYGKIEHIFRRQSFPPLNIIGAGNFYWYLTGVKKNK